MYYRKCKESSKSDVLLEGKKLDSFNVVYPQFFIHQ